MSDRYEVIAPLAEGGMGEILLARRVGPAGFAKLVVLKKPKATAHSPALVAALIEEARLLAEIRHINVCQVLDLEEADGEYFLALEYLDGLTAWDLIAQAEDARRPLEAGAICGIVAQACEGLAAIHKLRGGVVHRDISPSNLMLTDDGTVKLLDLGIAKSADSDEHTPFGRVKGKLSYLSPEQVQGKPIDGRADLFSLGLVLYDLAKGERPKRDRVGAFVALELAGMPAPLGEIVRRATAADPAARYASAGEMSAALQAAGTALGGCCDRAELASWLAQRFSAELAHKRARLQHEDEHTVAQTLAGSRVLELRSALHLMPAATDGERLTGGTERLPLPDRERLTSSAYFGAEQLTARTAGSSRRRAIVLAALAAGGVAVAGAIVLTRHAADAPIAPAAPTSTQPPTPTAPAAASTTQPPPPTGPSQATTTQPLPTAASQPTPGTPTTTQAPPTAPSQPTTTPPPAHHATSSPKPRRPADHARRDGLLTVDSNPYAVITIDGKSIGTTPLYQVHVAAGKHQLRATDPSGRHQQRSVVIDDGRENRVRIEWGTP